MRELARLLPAPNVVPTFADLISVPYKRGARGPEAFDCYGLFRELARRCGMPTPEHNSNDTLERLAELAGMNLPFWEECERGPGALAAIRMPIKVDGKFVPMVTHCGMVLPYDYLLHSWEGSKCVVKERLGIWERRIAGFYRWVA